MNESIVILNSKLPQTVVSDTNNGFRFNIPKLFNNVSKIDLISLQISNIGSYTNSDDKYVYVNIDQIGANSYDCCNAGTFVVTVVQSYPLVGATGINLEYYENAQYLQSYNLERKQNMSIFSVSLFKDNMEPLLVGTENVVIMCRLHYDASI